MSTTMSLVVVLGAIASLLFLVMYLRTHVFVSLLLVSLLAGMATGMPPANVLTTIQKGMGDTLGFIAVIVGLGAIMGEFLRVSGGAERMADTVLRRFGDRHAPVALGVIGLLVCVPVFFDVAFVLLVPIVVSLSARTGQSMLRYAIPLLAGCAVGHAFIPPTPGPMAVAGILGADLGWVVLWGMVVGGVSMLVAGPLFGAWIASRVYVSPPAFLVEGHERQGVREDAPGFGTVMFLMLLPLVLIMLNTVSGAWLPAGSSVRAVLSVVGHPFVALLVTVLACFTILGTRRGMSRDEVASIATGAFQPVGIIILVTGAGGVFKQVLVDSGIGRVMGEAIAHSGAPFLIVVFVVAAVIRVLQGSATVAMVTTASLMAPVLTMFPVTAAYKGLVVTVIASGATVISHVNDSGFWLVSRYLGMNERQTLASWTVMETILGVVGLLTALAIAPFVS